jgi:hypothetical protein
MGEGWVKGPALGKGGLDWPMAWVDGFRRMVFGGHLRARKTMWMGQGGEGAMLCIAGCCCFFPISVRALCGLGSVGDGVSDLLLLDMTP